VATSIVACLSAAILAPLPALSEELPEQLRQRVEALREGQVQVGGESIAAAPLIAAVYERRGFRPLWNAATAGQLVDALRETETHGLLARDYHISAIEQRLRQGWPEATTTRSDLEILLSDAFVRLAYCLHFGKLNPTALDPKWNFSRRLDFDDPVKSIDNALSAGRIVETLEQLQPQEFFYGRLRRALAQLRETAKVGGWPTMSEGKALQPGDRGPRVSELRRRLVASGDLAGHAVVDDELFDDELAGATEAFQRRHGLNPDAQVGAATVAALNVPVERRIDQIRANLERARWVFRDLGSDFLVVNIAGFYAQLVRDRELKWTTRVVVGKPYSATPVFRSDMTYLVLNPTWTVPPGILRNEILPKVRRDPGYLAENRMSIVDSSGNVVDPATVDQSARFPHSIRQAPGPDNALGVVKFIFPNPYNVYLHDTPSKSLFEKAERTFSHGCIRVENPLDLAVQLLQDQEQWDRAAIDRTIASRKSTTVPLSEPLPVLVLYWTANVEDDGRVVFFQDPYSLDQAVIDGLNAEFKVTAADRLEGSPPL
jgi:murein L,D-transpeptidase YcbB/YkuD